MEKLVDRAWEHAQRRLQYGEDLTAWVAGERSDFVRFNRGKIRQAGTVEQVFLTLRMFLGLRHASAEISLSGDAATDHAAIDRTIEGLRALLPLLPEDPHLLRPPPASPRHHHRPDTLPPATEMVRDVIEAAEGQDLVGIFASGSIFRAFRSNWGAEGTFSASPFNLDWYLYEGADRAVKSTYAGFSWDRDVLAGKMAGASHQLSFLSRAPTTVPPGDYRVFLAPAAVESVVGLVAGWGGFSVKAERTATSPLLQMAQGRAHLSPRVFLTEATRDGVGPTFSEEGFQKPDQVELIRAGRIAGHLVSGRSAREYDLHTTGSAGDEAPQALQMAGGHLKIAEALQALGTGIWISNLWYLNWSDRAQARMTGMTRFASFWVENGEIVAPLSVMRFDDSVYRTLGSELEALTEEAELLLSADTYYQRSTLSAVVPGALVGAFRFTL